MRSWAVVLCLFIFGFSYGGKAVHQIGVKVKVEKPAQNDKTSEKKEKKNIEKVQNYPKGENR